MGYRDLIREIQDASGLSSRESREVLDNTVESLAALLDDEEREEFASQLPSELQYVALDAEPLMTTMDSRPRTDLLSQFVERQQVDEDEARTLIGAAWQAIKDAMSGGEASYIRSQLPGHSADLLPS